MAINATDAGGGGSYTPVERGTYVARCYEMIHLGSAIENIKGKEKMINKVRITWELPTELKEFREGDGEKPFVVSQDYTLSTNEKSNLRKMIEGWRGKEFTDEEAASFDITKLLGLPCMINVIHRTAASKKVYANVASVSRLPKKMECPPQVNPTFELNFDDHWDEKAFAKLPDFITDRIKRSEEYRSMVHPEGGASSSEVLDDDEILDDLPF